MRGGHRLHDCGLCRPRAKAVIAARLIAPDGITLTERGKGSNTRYIHNIAMENEDYCDSLLVTEVYTPSGHWSSYPSHRHDEDDFPRITYLEETYYHRVNPANGFAIQRVYNDDGSLDETMAVKNGDVVLVPRGYHPCAAPYGFDSYYLNVMAGPRVAIGDSNPIPPSNGSLPVMPNSQSRVERYITMLGFTRNSAYK